MKQNQKDISGTLIIDNLKKLNSWNSNSGEQKKTIFIPLDFKLILCILHEEIS